LSEPQYKNISASIIAHEFYHTLGFPDKYNTVTGSAFSEDIMGLGRLRPIEETFIDSDILKRAGL